MHLIQCSLYNVNRQGWYQARAACREKGGELFVPQHGKYDVPDVVIRKWLNGMYGVLLCTALETWLLVHICVYMCAIEILIFLMFT